MQHIKSCDNPSQSQGKGSGKEKNKVGVVSALERITTTWKTTYLAFSAAEAHWACVTVEIYVSTSIVGDFDFAGWAGLAVGDAAVGELVVLALGFGTFFLVGEALQVAGCEGLMGFVAVVTLNLYLADFLGRSCGNAPGLTPCPPPPFVVG